MAATAALSALMGATIGMLQVKGVIDRDDAAAIFSLADSLLPAAYASEGTDVIGVAKIAADHVAEENKMR